MSACRSPNEEIPVVLPTGAADPLVRYVEPSP